MTGLAWKINRLRAMSLAELAHRGGRWIAQWWERVRIGTGWAPQPKGSVVPGIALFQEPPGWLAQWRERYVLDPRCLEDLASGRIVLFGHEPLGIGCPVDWHRDPLTGIRAPLRYGKTLNYRDDSVVGNVKFLWEVGRHQHLVPLAVAYAVSGEVRYRDAVVGQIEGWVRANPYGLGIHWCSALEVALRLISWSLAHSLIALRDGADGLIAAVGDPALFGRSIYQQAYFVRFFLSRYSSANNHLIGELTGLWVACVAFDLGREGRAWSRFAHRALECEARTQVHPDGVDKEQALYYHLWVLEYLLISCLVGERAGRPFSAEFRARITAMATFLTDITPPDGVPPQIGDADDGFVARFDPSWPDDPYRDVLIAVSAALAGSRVSGALPQKAFWYQALSSMPDVPSVESAGEGIRQYPRLYQAGGYAILGNGPVHLVFDAGQLGYPSIAAHGHADALSVCLALDGVWWLVDPGTYAYHSDPEWRNYFRSTAAHNTLVIDGREQSDMAGPFLWTRHARARLVRCESLAGGVQEAEGWHDGYRTLGLTHRRILACDPAAGTLEIRDILEGEGAHLCELYFHFAPELRVVLTEGGRQADISSMDSGRVLRMELAEGWDWRVIIGRGEPPLGWYSPALERKVPAPVLVGARQLSLPGAVVTRFLFR